MEILKISDKDQCPSFLNYVNAGRFLPVFFFSMFATAHDTNISNANERAYLHFDYHGVLIHVMVKIEIQKI